MCARCFERSSDNQCAEKKYTAVRADIKFSFTICFYSVIKNSLGSWYTKTYLSYSLYDLKDFTEEISK